MRCASVQNNSILLEKTQSKSNGRKVVSAIGPPETVSKTVKVMLVRDKLIPNEIKQGKSNEQMRKKLTDVRDKEQKKVLISQSQSTLTLRKSMRSASSVPDKSISNEKKQPKSNVPSQFISPHEDVPYHKQEKQKSQKNQLVRTHVFLEKQIVFAKMRGYASWPARVCI